MATKAKGAKGANDDDDEGCLWPFLLLLDLPSQKQFSFGEESLKIKNQQTLGSILQTSQNIFTLVILNLLGSTFVSIELLLSPILRSYLTLPYYKGEEGTYNSKTIVLVIQILISGHLSLSSDIIFLPNLSLFCPILPRAAKMRVHLLWQFHIKNTDAPPWGTWLRTLHFAMASQKGKNKKNKSPSSGGIQTQDLSDFRLTG